MNFLARLAAKAVGEFPLLRPRVTSWYADGAAPVESPPADEPSSPRMAPAKAHPVIAATVPHLGGAADPDGSAPLPRPAASMRSEAPSPERRARTPAIPSKPADENRRPTRAASEIVNPPAPARVTAEPVVRPPHPPAVPAPAALGPAAPSPPPLASVRPRAPDPSALQPTAPAAPTELSPPRAATAAAVVPDRPGRGWLAQPTPLLAVPHPPPARVLPPAAAVSGVPRTADAEAAAPAEAAAIEVTIGRVDVRAVTPPPAERRKPPQAPRLSLDEYLRRRPGASA